MSVIYIEIWEKIKRIVIYTTKERYMVKIYLPQKKIHFGYNGQINSYRYIDLARTKYNYIMITASKSEYFKLFPHTYSFNNVLTFDGNDEDITSGVIMLMLSVPSIC